MENNKRHTLEDEIRNLRIRILPILHFCQIHKVDLQYHKSYPENIESAIGYFCAFHSGLLCRILFYIETEDIDSDFIYRCNQLLNAYDWDLLERHFLTDNIARLQNGEFPDSRRDKIVALLQQFKENRYKNDGDYGLMALVCREMPPLDKSLAYNSHSVMRQGSSNWEFNDVRGNAVNWLERNGNI